MAETAQLVAPTETTQRRGQVTIAFITLAAFGPYLISGFRTEQIAVYGIALALTVSLWCVKARPSNYGAGVLALLVLQLTVAVIGAVDPPQNTTRYQLGNVLAGVDNLALPIAVLAIVWMLLAAGADQRALIRIVCWVTVWAMMINAGLAILATGGGGPDLAIFQGPGGLESVADRAEQMGRFSGIFNQPAEAGLMYSIALLAAVYLYRGRAVLLALAATLISIGGVLTVSKVFLFVGLPVGLWQVLRSSGGRQRRMAAFLAAIIITWGAAKSGLTPEWAGGNYLLRLLPGSNQGSVDLYTAGRFGDDSTLAVVAGQILKSSPVWGFGAGGLATAYDNGWIEQLAMNGLFGALILTATLAMLGAAWLALRRLMTTAESRFGGGLVLVAAGASFGLPALTANRCSTVLWLLFGLLLVSTSQPRPQRPVRTSGS